MAAELNLLPVEAWERSFKVLLTRLSTYEDTCLSLTHHYLYAMVSAMGYYPDRSFLPPARDEPLWEEHSIPWLVGVQSKRPGRDFGLVAVSNAVVQEMGNLLLFLRNSGFPVEARDRREREDLPLVVLGGANAPFSSLFWGKDSPVDGVFVGEDRLGMEAMFRTVAAGRAAGLSKIQILETLGQIPGFLIPGRSTPVEPRPCGATLDPELLAAMPVALGEGNAGKATLAVSGGCAGFCSFCAESWTRKPYTEASAEALTDAALRVKAGQGAHKLDVFSFNFNMHQELYPFLEAVVPWFSGLGLKSQRFDSLAADPLLVDLEKLFGKTWFTCGLEGISERLRRALNKNLDVQQLHRAFGVIARSGVRELKTFLIATGWETEPDFEEFGRLLATIRSLPGSGRPLKVVFSVTPLVRFPHTPLEFDPAPDPKEIDRSARRILRVAREHGFEGRIAAPAEELAACDLMVRPPGEEIFETWAKTILEDSFAYRDEIPLWFLRHWQLRLNASGWTEERVRGAYGVEANRSAPWARLDTGVRRTFLETQYGRNLAFQELAPAGLVRTSGANPALVRRWTEAWKARQSQQRPVVFSVTLTVRSVAAGRDQAGAALARALMLEDPLLAREYRGFLGSWWADSSGSKGYCALAGDDRFTLVFLPAAAELLSTWAPDDARWKAVNLRFEPFGVVRASVSPPPAEPTWAIEARCPWPLDGQKLLTSRGLKHTLRRVAPGHWSYDFPALSLKKDWLRTLESFEEEGGWVHRLVPGSKWDWRSFLEEGFDYPAEGGASRVRLIATEGFLRPH